MKIQKIYSYLSYPSKHEEQQPEIGGATIPHKGRLYEMLKDIFDKSDKECNIPICFTPDANGAQNNACRNEIIALINSSGITAGRKIAERLQSVTTGKSGMGLLFLIVAQEEKTHKIMISRFPADQGIMAEQNSKTLKVEFVEQVFLKNANAYKSAVYKGASTAADFWLGDAVDKQTNHGIKDVANYWIREFLLSDFKTTSKAGTKRLAIALKDAITNTDDLGVKHELTSSAILARNMGGKNTSIAEFYNQFHLSDNAKAVINKQLKSMRLAGDKFQFDIDEFTKHISYKTLEIDNGAILTAPVDKFDKCFKEQGAENSRVRTFQTSGRVINEKLKKSK
ncbi:MAG: hypothetical protein AABZ84_03740 [Pseudomonadota bacterium]